MNYPATLGVKFTNGTKLFKGTWVIEDGQGHIATFEFETDHTFDQEVYSITWKRPDGTDGKLDRNVDLENLSPADRARALLFRISAKRLSQLREEIHPTTLRERWMGKNKGATIEKELLPMKVYVYFGDEQDVQAMGALFEEYAQQ